MARIIVAGTVDLDPELREATLAGAWPYIEQARGERGCIAYNWTLDPYEPMRIHVFEEWTSEEELAEHLSGAPYKSMLVHLQDAGISNAVTQKYKIENFEPVYDETGTPQAKFTTSMS